MNRAIRFCTDDRLSAYGALLAYMAAYPLVYFGVAWIFYHGLKPTAPPRG